jgi:integrase
MLTPITAVSRILGHSSVEVTLNTYAHFSEEGVVKAMENLRDYFENFTE